jgi:hypothetical protein
LPFALGTVLGPRSTHSTGIGPDEWGFSGHKFEKFLATVKLLADHTWEILAENND